MSKPDKIKMLEKLAELEHKQWSELIQFMLKTGYANGPEIPRKELWREYDRLSRLSYGQLSERQKESDRKFARKVLELLEVEAK